GCTAVVDGVTHELPGRKVEVADTVGAGDAFMSGLLFALVSDGSDRLLVAGEPLGTDRVARALDTAVASAAVAVSRAGAQPPHRDELV
ncbi:MAG: PfkB family carbohydrate kinase, partial [Corynebacterium sp.]|uniref:PfkB family carbohydrate kinase n=1 Tax=Corynebacterium sp. TaxID=1720 RepID=UPI003F90C924